VPTQGPSFPSTAVNNSVAPENTDAWVNPTNVFSDNATEAAITAASFDSPDISQQLVTSGYGFTIPVGSTIDGITVEVDRRSIIASSGVDNRVQLRDASGTLVGTNKATATVWPSSSTIATYGGAADTWTASPTVAMVNDPDFGVVLSAKANIANADIGVDYIRITVTYTEPAIVTAQAHGRVRVHATADAVAITIEADTPLSPIRGKKQKYPTLKRVASRVIGGLVPVEEATVITAAARGRIRVHARAATQGIVLGLARGRVRVRARSTTLTVVHVSAIGRLRLRSRNITSQFVLGRITGRIRIRSRNITSQFVLGRITGRARLRSVAVGEVQTPGGAIVGQAHGRVRIRSRATALTFPKHPTYPQSSDTDPWDQSVGELQPASSDTDSWNQSASEPQPASSGELWPAEGTRSRW